MTFSPEAVITVIDALNEIGAPYIITGSLARNVYCVPRSTIDADFVVDMSSEQFETLRARLRNHFDHDRQLTFETATGTFQHRFRHPDTKFLIEIFEAQPDDPHERSRFERRREVRVEGRTTFVPTAEDIIVQKLRWIHRVRRPKDAADVHEVIAALGQTLDWPYVERWAEVHDTTELLNEFRGEASES